MLESQDLKQLLQKAQAGDGKSQEIILEHNLNLVRSVLKRFSSCGYEWDDLFQIGCIGLIKAIQRFNLSFNVSFSTYAVPMIIGEIRRFMRDDNPVKISRPIKELSYKIHRVQDYLNGVLGREPSITEIAQELHVSINDIVTALEAVQTPTSIYTKSFHESDDGALVLDQRKYCEDDERKNFEKLVLQEVVSRLPEKEKQVIILRFFEDKTQAEVASLIGLSQVQISRIEKNALRQIRQFIGAF